MIFIRLDYTGINIIIQITDGDIGITNLQYRYYYLNRLMQFPNLLVFDPLNKHYQIWHPFLERLKKGHTQNIGNRKMP